MSVRRLIKKLFLGFCAVLVLLAAVWLGLDLLPLSPKAEMHCKILKLMRQQEKQCCLVLENVAVGEGEEIILQAYSTMRANRKVLRGFSNKAHRYSTIETIVMVREFMLTLWKMRSHDSMLAEISKGENIMAAGVDFEALLTETESCFLQLASGLEKKESRDACAALALQWKQASVAASSNRRESDWAKIMETRMAALLPGMRPSMERYLDDTASESFVSAALQELPPLRYIHAQVLASDAERAQKLHQELHQTENNLSELLRGVTDKASAQAHVKSITAAWAHRERILERLAPVLVRPRQNPEFRNQEPQPDGLMECIDGLRRLPEPFYGCESLRKLFPGV